MIADTATEIASLSAGVDMDNNPKSIRKSTLRGNKVAAMGTLRCKDYL